MNLKIGIVAASLFGGLVASSAAFAMPIAPAPATPQLSGVEQVRMVCNAWGALLVAPELLRVLRAAAILRPAVLWAAALLRSALLRLSRLSPLVTFEGAFGPLRFCEIVPCVAATACGRFKSDPDQG